MSTVSTKNFGQFLHERGLLDGAQLLHVLEQQKAASATLGDLAVASGALDPSAMLAIRNEQLRNGMDFGSAAVSLELLSEQQVAELDAQFEGKRTLMSRLLSENGYVDPTRLAQAEFEYFEDSMVRTLRLKLTLEQARHPRIAEISASVLQRLYERVMGSPLELGICGTVLPKSGGDRVWSQALHVGDETFSLAMQMTEGDALAVAAVVLGIELDEFDELAEDAVSEFLNIVIGHICGNLPASDDVRADPPKVTSAEEFGLASAETVVLECDGDEIVFHFALP